MGAGVRAQQSAAMDMPVTSLRHVNEKRAHALERMGIFTVRDLLENFPHRYLDMSEVTSVADARIGDTVTIVGRVGEVNVKKPRPRLTIVEVALIDDTGVLFGTWFSQPWMAGQLHPGDIVTFAGKVEFNYGFKRMNSPFHETLESAEDRLAGSGGNPATLGDGRPPAGSGSAAALGRVIPLHHLTADISSAWMRRLIDTALVSCDSILDPIPACLRITHGLMSRQAAYKAVHFPPSLVVAGEARRRIAYEELLCLQLHLMMRRAAEVSGQMPVTHVVDGQVSHALKAALPFKLSGEQQQAIKDILGDMAASRVMNRMLLGDVGTGKTVVAAFALAAACDSGTQAAMMAPTSVLAAQYARKLGPLLDAAGAQWALLTGATPPDERERILARLAAGRLPVVFGTHALLQDDVEFAKLTLAVIDEQHRFGVDQRAALRSKGTACDLLLMTATPIPRTLALTLYGDLECSYIKERPVKLAPCKTKVLKSKDRSRAYDAIREAVKQGRQAYIVCPLVGVPRAKGADAAAYLQQSEDLQNNVELATMKAAEQEVRFLATKVFPEMRLGLLTGRMKAGEKAEVMDAFCAGGIDVLVSTTVIEVGIDVPNATVLMVEDADRFGLSQLHQLRGRVGRGKYPGTVFLIADPKTDEAKERLAVLAKTADGFELAEQDLRLRKEGDILGSKQHGAACLKLVNVVRDADLVALAHDDARFMLDADLLLRNNEHIPLQYELEIMFTAQEDLGRDA